MALDPTDVRKIAELARLEISDSELTIYTHSLAQILDLVGQMNVVDTTGISPMAHPSDSPLRLRQDLVTEQDHREGFQKIAPATESGLYLVPKVIE
ncbi:MAG TPA: Asp-tRNA(Asn)/Glu-tRNA(Gln) amidotransferase subunit GatC [Acidiferrobacteraceae bacterium]|nr:Asp-tRNA(Asn)/Glu-tRNA(Gln) amidotransferase subunit GatC [Acidiferrobacteraceae bacterium]